MLLLSRRSGALAESSPIPFACRCSACCSASPARRSLLWPATSTNPWALTSLYLLALEARGLLSPRRVGRLVSYRPGAATGPSTAAGLVAALRASFQREAEPIGTIFRLATAFTHPRRIELFRLLQTGPRTLGQLRAAAHISGWALLRHLKKLEARGFITQREGLYAVADQPDGLGRELARQAAK